MSKEADEQLLYLRDVVGLGPLLALHDLKFDWVALLQALITFAMDGAVVHEHIRTILSTDKAEAFGIIEPFNGSF